MFIDDVISQERTPPNGTSSLTEVAATWRAEAVVARVSCPSSRDCLDAESSGRWDRSCPDVPPKRAGTLKWGPAGTEEDVQSVPGAAAAGIPEWASECCDQCPSSLWLLSWSWRSIRLAWCSLGTATGAPCVPRLWIDFLVPLVSLVVRWDLANQRPSEGSGCCCCGC